MPQPKNFVYSYKELAKVLVLDAKIESGLWGLYLGFGIAGSNVGPNDTDIKPAAIVAITEVGIQQFETPNGLTVDAAEVQKEAREGKGLGARK